MTRPAALLAALACALLAACNGSSTPKPPSASSSAPAASSPTAALADQLEALATKETTTSFHAVYAVHRAKPASNARLVVDHTPRSVRVDVTTKATTATLIVTPHGSFACSRKRHSRACYRVAKAGRPVQPPFNLAPQNVFTSDLAALATPGYTVQPAASLSARPGHPPAACFAVRPTQAASKPAAPAGVYCFATDGLLVAVTYPSGNSLRLRSARMAMPAARVFRPYAKPVPVP